MDADENDRGESRLWRIDMLNLDLMITHSLSRVDAQRIEASLSFGQWAQQHRESKVPMVNGIRDMCRHPFYVAREIDWSRLLESEGLGEVTHMRFICDISRHERDIGRSATDLPRAISLIITLLQLNT